MLCYVSLSINILFILFIIYRHLFLFKLKNKIESKLKTLCDKYKDIKVIIYTNKNNYVCIKTTIKIGKSVEIYESEMDKMTTMELFSIRKITVILNSSSKDYIIHHKSIMFRVMELMKILDKL